MNDLLNLWDDIQARHAMLVHVPIVLGGLGVLPLILLAMTGFRSTALKIVCVLWFVAASAGAGLAAGSGEEAEDELVYVAPALSRAEAEAVKEHEELGEGGWIWPLIPAVLVAATFVQGRKTKRSRRGEGGAASDASGEPTKRGGIGQKVAVPAGLLAIAASLGVAGWVALTAHAGGSLVYEYGLGVPRRGLAELGGAGGDARRDRGEREGHEEHDDD
jgi:hypothetical protein